MELTIWTVSALLSILGLIWTAYLAYKIYVFNRLGQGWLAMLLAFVLLIFHRLIVYAHDFELFTDLHPLVLKAWQTLLFIIVGILWIIGMSSMKKSFETFDIVQKKTREKIRQLSKKKRADKQ